MGRGEKGREEERRGEMERKKEEEEEEECRQKVDTYICFPRFRLCCSSSRVSLLCLVSYCFQSFTLRVRVANFLFKISFCVDKLQEQLLISSFSLFLEAEKETSGNLFIIRIKYWQPLN